MNEDARPVTASATGDQPSWHKSLRWQDGVYMMMPMTGAVFISSGFMIPVLGAWGSVIVIGIMSTVALLSNFLFAEMACMFPTKTGGLSMYCREALRRHFIPGGVLGSYGYWLGYALSIGFVALQLGTVVKSQWFAGNAWSLPIPGGVDMSMAHLIAIGSIVVCWGLCIVGVKVTTRIALLFGALIGIVVVLCIIGPLFSGNASTANLQIHLPGWTATAVWCYIAGWTLFASELGASFGPEYKRPEKDLPRVLLIGALGMMMLYNLGIIGTTAELGEAAIGENPLFFGPVAANSIFGGGGQIFTFIYAASLFVTLLVFMTDCTRATAGMAEEGVSIKQLGNLNRFGSPTWSTHLVAFVNVLVLLFVSSPVGIILASNLGYILAHSLGNLSFIILRRTHPEWPRPYKLKSRAWMLVAVVLMCFHIYVLYVGVANPGLAGYGGVKETLIGVAVLCSGLILWVVRVVFQDHERLRIREGDALPAVPALQSEGAK